MEMWPVPQEGAWYPEQVSLRFGAMRAGGGRPLGGGRAPRGCWVLRQDSRGARGPGRGHRRRTLMTRMPKALSMKMTSMETSFSPSLGYSLQFTPEVSGACVPSATSRTPSAAAQRSQMGVPGDGLLRQMKPAAPPLGISIIRYEAGNGGVPILRALRLRPLLFIPLSAEARARPGREAAVPGGRPAGARCPARALAHLRPGSQRPERKPRMGTPCVGAPCAAAVPALPNGQ